MKDPATIVSIVSVGAALVLALRGYRSHGNSRQKMMLMGLAWVIIIAGLAVILGRMGGS